MDLTTTARVKTLGSITTSDQDALIGVLVTAVSARIERYLGRHVESTSRTEYYDVEAGQHVFYLRGYPISSVTSVKNDEDWDFDNIDEIASSEFTTVGSDFTGRLVVDEAVTPIAGKQALQVVYTGGMAADAASFIAAFPDVALAADQQILHEYQRRKQLGIVSSSIGQHTASVEFGVDLLPIVKRALNPYRRMVAGGAT